MDRTDGTFHDVTAETSHGTGTRRNVLAPTACFGAATSPQ